MAFQQGLSGLASSSKALDVISNNVANTSTAGFKGSTAIFADMYASALTGAVSSVQIGIGGTVNAVRQAFNQGNLTTTNNPLDMAINGNGFFMVGRNDGTTAFSRNGQFDIDKDGFIVTPLGEQLMGFQRDPATGLIPVSGGSVAALNVPQSEIPPNATTGVELTANLDASGDLPAVATFDPDDAESYNGTTTVEVFDSQGTQHSLSLYFVRTAPTTANTWDVYSFLDGQPPTVATPTPLAFDALGAPTGTTTTNPTWTLNSGAGSLGFEVDMSNLTQFGSDFSVTDVIQDGYRSGQIAGISISRNGVIEGRYTNGQTQELGQVALATFRSPNGLTSLGNNLWASSPESGPAIVNKPGSGLNGVISAGQIEESNVDLTQELVQMIIQQRNYQANAQSIRTQDQILQTLVNLR